ncbi:MAG TPA: type II secretion system protein [Candidatus Saccharimonadales bacterium]|nr:type II secretion system protein [Candidatus Saccharimonadales bacterium]
MLRKMLKEREGFTLIEIVFVLAIAALIIVIVFLAVAGARNSAQDQARKDYANRIAAACTKWSNEAAGVNGDTKQCNDSAAYLAQVLAIAGAAPSISGTALTATTNPASTANVNVGDTTITVQLTNASGPIYTANL